LADLRHLGLAALAILGACGEPASEEEAARWDAALACLERANPLIGKLEQAQSLPQDDDTPEFVWRVGEDGHFVAEMNDHRDNRTSQFLFTCAGNLKNRTIDLVQMGQEEIRPAANEVWSF